MSDYLTDVQLLGSELVRVEQAFRGLASSDWRRPTLLQPPGDTLPPWTIFELAGHLDIAVGVTRMLISSQQDGQVSRDRVSFFIFPRSQVAPVFYDYAYTMVEGKSPGQMADVLAETFTRTIDEARATSPDVAGKFEFDDDGDEVLMRLGEFVPSRMVEAVVHGLDLTDALGHDPVATPQGVAMTAAILDELLARRTVPGRPAGLADDMAWIRAASGRSPHPDPRLPLLG
jgi:Mycothiol maleylpyruvate isomerase N-terminal domain